MLSATAGNEYCQKLQIRCVDSERPLRAAQFERCGLLGGLLGGLLNVSKTTDGRSSQSLINAAASNTAKSMRPDRLLFKDHRRGAGSLRLEGDGCLDTVGDLDEGNAAVHSVLFAVEGHRPFNLA
jgi:hypothetical protein